MDTPIEERDINTKDTFQLIYNDEIAAQISSADGYFPLYKIDTNDKNISDSLNSVTLKKINKMLDLKYQSKRNRILQNK